MEVTLIADGRAQSGGSGSMLMHNERLADPLDPFARALKEVTSKRVKTEVDHVEIARVEFLGGLYTNPVIEAPESVDGQVPAIPTWNLLACLEEGAKRHKKGKDVLRGVAPLDEFATFTFADPTSGKPYGGSVGGADLWTSGTFQLRKGIKIGGRKTMRTRPLFQEWEARARVHVDDTIFDLDTLRLIWASAGRYAGLGDRRPVFGRFSGTVEPVKA